MSKGEIDRFLEHMRLSGLACYREYTLRYDYSWCGPTCELTMSEQHIKTLTCRWASERGGSPLSVWRA